MAQYGEVAKLAVELVNSAGYADPAEAWRAAAQRLIRSPSSRDKACPRTTFLGLCGSGAVKGIPRGSYTSAPDNPVYAAQALSALQSTPELAANRARLWAAATGGKDVRQNGQMDVVTTLWLEGLLQ